MGLPPEFHEDGAPEYPPLPDEYNRGHREPPAAPSKKSRMRQFLLLVFVGGLTALGLLFPRLGAIAEPAPEPTYKVTAYLDTPSAGSGYLTTEDGAQSGVTVEAPEGAAVRLHLVPNAPFTEDDVSVSGVALEGEVYATDDPLVFTVGKGGGVIHFSMQYPPVELYTVQARHEPPSGAKAYLTVEGSDQGGDGYTGISVREGMRVRLHYTPVEPYTLDDVTLGGTMLEGALYETDDPLVFTVGKGGGVIHFYLNFKEPDEPLYTVELFHDQVSAGQCAYLTVDGREPNGETPNSVLAPEGATVRVHVLQPDWRPERDGFLGYLSTEGALYETDDPQAFTVGKGDGVIHYSILFPTPVPTATPTPSPKPSPTPAPAPDVTATYYRRSAVYTAFVKIALPEAIESVRVRMWDETAEAAVYDYELTPEEIACAYFFTPDMDLSAFYFEHQDEFNTAGREPDPVLLVDWVENFNGVRTEKSARYAADEELWIDVGYDLPDPEQDIVGQLMYGETYPDSFVVRIYDAPTDTISITLDPDRELAPGDVFVSITADGKAITDVGSRRITYGGEFEDGAFYAIILVLPRPADFPESGTVQITVTQKLLHSSVTLSRIRDYNY